MNKIRLTRLPTGWVATFSGPHACHVESLFGTATIPTAFGASASLDMVRASIRDLNPGCTIVAKCENTAAYR